MRELKVGDKVRLNEKGCESHGAQIHNGVLAQKFNAGQTTEYWKVSSDIGSVFFYTFHLELIETQKSGFSLFINNIEKKNA